MIIRVFIVEEGSRKERNSIRWQHETVLIKADGLEDIGRVMSQGMWQPLEAGKDKETDSPLEPAEGTSETDFVLLTSKTVRE